MQGVASLYQAVGSKQAADAILQNFRQRLVFSTEDDATMSMVQRLLGQVDAYITSTSEGSSHWRQHKPLQDALRCHKTRRLRVRHWRMS
jgi:type IV secretory pathway TraG/TraD family ATPase VirD4